MIVVDHGQVIADDTPAALKANLAGDRITLTVPAHVDAHPRGGRARGLELRQRSPTGTSSSVRPAGPRPAAGVLGDLAAGRRRPRGHLHDPSLDDVFLALTGRSLREGAAA